MCRTMAEKLSCLLFGVSGPATGTEIRCSAVLAGSLQRGCHLGEVNAAHFSLHNSESKGSGYHNNRKSDDNYEILHWVLRMTCAIISYDMLRNIFCAVMHPTKSLAQYRSKRQIRIEPYSMS